MSNFLQDYLKNYTSGHSNARKMEEMFENPGDYTYEEFANQIDKAKYIPAYEDFLGNSDDDEYNERRADEQFGPANSAYLSLRSNLLNEFSNANQAANAAPSSAPSSAPAPAPAPAAPEPKLPVLAPDRDFSQGDSGQGDSGQSADSGSDQDPITYLGMTPAEYEDYLDTREYEQTIGLDNLDYQQNLGLNEQRYQHAYSLGDQRYQHAYSLGDQRYQHAYSLGDQDARSRALITALNNESAREVASIRSTASMYGSDRTFDATDVSSRRDKEARMYASDREKEAILGKATIDGAFGVTMQNIIAAGAQDVEKIRGEYGLAGQQIAGEYGLERSRIEGATARDVANRQRDASIFGALVSGFWS